MSEDRMRLMLAYVHPGSVRNEFMESVIQVLGAGLYAVELVHVESGTNVQKARNQCVRWFLESDCDYFMFVDTDMVFSADVPQRLAALDVPIVSALYLGRGGDGKAYPVGMMWEDGGGPGLLGGPVMNGEFKRTESTPEGHIMRYLKMADLTEPLTEVAGVGMGCCLIRREVLEALRQKGGHPDHWPFAEGQTVTPNGMLGMSEDITFCVRASLVGFKSYISKEVTAGHVKPFVLRLTEDGKAQLGVEMVGVRNG